MMTRLEKGARYRLSGPPGTFAKQGLESDGFVDVRMVGPDLAEATWGLDSRDVDVPEGNTIVKVASSSSWIPVTSSKSSWWEENKTPLLYTGIGIGAAALLLFGIRRMMKG